MSIFNVSNEEAKRIRLLHEEESNNKKISSSLNEAPMALCGGPYPGTGGPVGGAVHWTGNCPGSPNLLNPFPCARIDGQTPNSSHIGWQINMDGGALDFCATVSSVGPFNGQSTSATPTSLERSNSCTDCDTPYGSGGPGSYDCNGTTCVGQQGTGGQFASLAACQQNCQQPDKYKCNNGVCSQDPSGQYSSMSACQAACEPDRTWNCTKMGHCLAVNNSSGQYNTEQDCLQNCEQPTYNCKWVSGEPGETQGKKANPFGGEKRNLQEQVPISGYQCVPHQGAGTGQYPNLQACQAVCGEEPKRTYCVNCEKQIMRYYPGMPNGSQTSCGPGFVDIGTNPSPMPGPCVECQNNNCIQGNGWGGEFNSMALCQASPNCGTSLPDYECVNGTCLQQNGGQFTGPNALADCQGVCGLPTLWECDTTNGCSQTQNGTYSSQGQCETACCQDVINNWGWAQGGQNNPCQKFHNLFYQNPPTTFVDQCKYDYLYNLVLNLPGANPCVQGNFINLLDGFMAGNNQCYGNPNSGCDTSPGAPFTGPYSSCPHQNSVCGKRDQFCGITNQSPSQYFKCQYAINFASANTCVC